MLTNIKSECNAPFLVFTLVAHNYLFQKKFTSLPKMSFNIEYSCHTNINIKHDYMNDGWRYNS